MDKKDVAIKGNGIRFTIEMIVSLFNVASLVRIASKCVYRLEIPFLIVSILFVYIVPFSAYSYGIIKKYRHIDDSTLEVMRYSTRSMFLSQIMFTFAKKILDAISNLATQVMIKSVGFAIWLAVGNKGTLTSSIKDFTDSLKISKVIVKVHSIVSTWFEQILEQIFKYEIIIVDKLIGRKQSGQGVESNQDADMAPEEYVKIAREEYMHNIERARSGDAEAQVIVGKYCLNYGSQDEAVKWFIKAAKLGKASAYMQLGHCYMEGIGVEVDRNRGINLYKKAAAMQDTTAMCFLADYFISKTNKQEIIDAAVKLYSKAASLGDAYAQERLGIIYYDGKYVDKKESQAYIWLKKSVEEGNNFHGGYYLAKCYLDGIGTEVNSRKGIEILKRTVAEGGGHFVECLKLLSECYKKGIGVNKNIYMANIYMQKAEQQNQLIQDI